VARQLGDGGGTGKGSDRSGLRGSPQHKLLLTDSQAALISTLNLSKRSPPRSRIDVEIKNALRKRAGEDMAIAWVRSYIGIPGNEQVENLRHSHPVWGKSRERIRAPQTEESGRPQEQPTPPGDT